MSACAFLIEVLWQVHRINAWNHRLSLQTPILKLNSMYATLSYVENSFSSLVLSTQSLLSSSPLPPLPSYNFLIFVFLVSSGSFFSESPLSFLNYYYYCILEHHTLSSAKYKQKGLCKPTFTYHLSSFSCSSCRGSEPPKSKAHSRGSHQKILRHPTSLTMYCQPPKWVKTGFGKSVIICPNWAGMGFELQKNRLQNQIKQ